MSIAELLFLVLAFVTLLTLVTGLAFLAMGKLARAARIAMRLGFGAAVYFAIVIAVSLVAPRGEYRVGDTRRFDDWCIAVVEARRVEAPTGGSYDVSLRLSNRARGWPMGEKGTVAYLADEQGHRYDPKADPDMVPFDTVLQPGASVIAKRHFDVPSGARGVGLVYRHEGGFPIGWLIIGEGGWFAQPSIVRFD